MEKQRNRARKSKASKDQRSWKWHYNYSLRTMDDFSLDEEVCNAENEFLPELQNAVSVSE